MTPKFPVAVTILESKRRSLVDQSIRSASLGASVSTLQWIDGRIAQIDAEIAAIKAKAAK